MTDLNRNINVLIKNSIQLLHLVSEGGRDPKQLKLYMTKLSDVYINQSKTYITKAKKASVNEQLGTASDVKQILSKTKDITQRMIKAILLNTNKPVLMEGNIVIPDEIKEKLGMVNTSSKKLSKEDLNEIYKIAKEKGFSKQKISTLIKQYKTATEKLGDKIEDKQKRELVLKTILSSLKDNKNQVDKQKIKLITYAISKGISTKDLLDVLKIYDQAVKATTPAQAHKKAHELLKRLAEKQETAAATTNVVTQVKTQLAKEGVDPAKYKEMIDVLSVDKKKTADDILKIVKDAINKNKPVHPPVLFEPLFFGGSFSVKYQGVSSKTSTTTKEQFTIFLNKMLYYFLQSYQNIMKKKATNLISIATDLKAIYENQKNIKNPAYIKSKIQKVTKIAGSFQDIVEENSVLDKRLKTYSQQYKKYYEALKEGFKEGTFPEHIGDLEQEKQNSLFLPKLMSFLGTIVGYVVYIIKYIILYVKRFIELYKTHLLIGLGLVASLVFVLYIFIALGRKQEKMITGIDHDKNSLISIAAILRIIGSVFKIIARKA